MISLKQSRILSFFKLSMYTFVAWLHYYFELGKLTIALTLESIWWILTRKPHCSNHKQMEGNLTEECGEQSELVSELSTTKTIRLRHHIDFRFCSNLSKRHNIVVWGLKCIYDKYTLSRHQIETLIWISLSLSRNYKLLMSHLGDQNNFFPMTCCTY